VTIGKWSICGILREIGMKLNDMKLEDNIAFVDNLMESIRGGSIHWKCL
jgi:hypothetical protein